MMLSEMMVSGLAGFILGLIVCVAVDLLILDKTAKEVTDIWGKK